MSRIKKRGRKRKEIKKEVGLEKEYFTTITVKCPKTGKLVTQKVKVKKYKTKSGSTKDAAKSNTDPIDKLEESNDGLTSYGESLEDLDI